LFGGNEDGAENWVILASIVMNTASYLISISRPS
jgi:hypothetical protein